MLGQDTLVSIRVWIRSPWAIISTLVPVISDKVIAELTVEEWLSNRLFPCKEFFGAVWVEYLPISNGWDIGPSSKYVDPVRRAYKMIVFTELMADIHHLVVEIVSPTFCQGFRVLVGNICISFIPCVLISITVDEDKML